MPKLSSLDVSYYADWHNVPDEDVPKLLAEFAAAGAKRIVFGTNLLHRSRQSTAFLKMLLRELERDGLVLDGSHAPFSQAGLNMPESPERQQVLRERLEMIALCGDLGIDTLTNHLSNREEFCDLEAAPEELRSRALRSLEFLLPQAEKHRVVLALENIFFPSDRPDELLAILDFFKSPFLGVCYDFGHANIVTARPGASDRDWPEKRKRIWRGRPVIWESDMLQRLLPEVVCLHMHDNDGVDDLHALPGTGTVEWKKLLPLLENAPRLVSPQTEVSIVQQNIPPELLCKTFRDLGFRS